MTRKGKYIVAGVAAACVGLVAAGAMAQRGHWDGHKVATTAAVSAPAS